MILKQWLSNKGETYESFAKRLNISVPFLCNILSGKQANVKVDLLLKIAELTKLDVAELAHDLLKRYNDYHIGQHQLEEDKGKEIL